MKTEEDNIIEIADSEEEDDEEDDEDEGPELVPEEEENRNEHHEPSDSIPPRDQSHDHPSPHGNRIDSLSQSPLQNRIPEPLQINVQGRVDRSEDLSPRGNSENGNRPIRNAEPQDGDQLSPQANPQNDATLANSQLNESLLRANTSAQNEAGIRHQPTNTGPLELRPQVSAELFVIEENPGLRNSNFTEGPQLTHHDSNALLPLSPLQVRNSTGLERDVPDTRQQLGTQNEGRGERRAGALGTINSAKSEEDFEKDAPGEKNSEKLEKNH